MPTGKVKWFNYEKATASFASRCGCLASTLTFLDHVLALFEPFALSPISTSRRNASGELEINCPHIVIDSG